MIYEPQEDSFMLAEQVKKYAFGKVLDLGCGSGIQGITALTKKEVKEVWFLDINEECITYVKNKITDSRSKFIISDLFSNLNKKEKFDTIIFNPPYLPEDKYDKSLFNVGGKKGYEKILLFLEQAKNYLNENGTILLIFSSISKKKVIDKKIKEQYVFEKIAEKKIFMEKLYIYKIEQKKIFKGHRGIVETINYTYKKNNVIAVKKYSKTKFYDAEKEAKILRILNKKGIGPKLYKYDKKNNSLIMEYINGQRIFEFINNHEKNEIIDIIKKILQQLEVLEDLHINKKEMTNPYKHIIIKYDNVKGNKEPVLIDFERATHSEKTKNITQFIQFLISGKMKYALKNKKMLIDHKKMIEIAKTYKNTNEKEVVEKIIECII